LGKETQESHMRIAIRALIVLASLGLAFLAYFRLFGTPVSDAVARWTALSAGSTLKVLGAPVETSGTIVASSDFAYSVVTECTIIGPLLLFAAAAVAYPSTLKSKALGIGMAVVSLSLINLVRLVSLYYIGAYYPVYLPVAHYVAWQAAIIVFTLLLWLWWVERFTRRRSV